MSPHASGGAERVLESLVMQSLGRKIATRKTGAEPFHEGERELHFDILRFWLAREIRGTVP